MVSAVDECMKKGLFILMGSTVIADKDGEINNRAKAMSVIAVYLYTAWYIIVLSLM